MQIMCEKAAIASVFQPPPPLNVCEVSSRAAPEWGESGAGEDDSTRLRLVLSSAGTLGHEKLVLHH